MNCFNISVSNTISPRTIFTGIKLDYNKHCKVGFGGYWQVHEELLISSLVARTTGAELLGCTYNPQGGYKLFKFEHW